MQKLYSQNRLLIETGVEVGADVGLGMAVMVGMAARVALTAWRTRMAGSGVAVALLQAFNNNPKKMAMAAVLLKTGWKFSVKFLVVIN